MAKKANAKKNGRPHAAHPAHATRGEAKPKRAAPHAHAKSSTTSHATRHHADVAPAAHPADSMVTAVIDSVTSIRDVAAKPKRLAIRAKAEVSNALTKTAPSLLGRIVGLMAGIVDAFLPKKLLLRKHAHSH